MEKLLTDTCLRILLGIGKYPVQTPLGAQMGLGSQPRYEAPGDLELKPDKRSD